MILADWNVFACKFSGNEQTAFEQLCYLLFCKWYGRETGISRYINNPGIETDPIVVDCDVIGWQAKYYQVALSQRKRELIDAVDEAHKCYPELTRLIFYCNRDFGAGKTCSDGVQDPAAKTETEDCAARLGIKIDWFLASAFESSFVLIENEAIARHFFSTDSSDAFGLGLRLVEQSKRYLNSIDASVVIKGEELKIDRSDLLEQVCDGLHKGNSVVLLTGDSGVGKTAAAKDFLSSLADDSVAVVVDCHGADAWRSEEDLLGGWRGFGLSDVLRAFQSTDKRYLLVDSAEYLFESQNRSLPAALLGFAHDGNWSVLLTVRSSCRREMEELVHDVFESAYTVVSVSGFSEDQARDYLIRLGYADKYFSIASVPPFRKPIIAKVLSKVMPGQITSEEALRDFVLNELYLKCDSEAESALRKETVFWMASRRLSLAKMSFTPDMKVLERFRKAGYIVNFDMQNVRFAHDYYEELAISALLNHLFSTSDSVRHFLAELKPDFATKKILTDWLIEDGDVKRGMLERLAEEVLGNEDVYLKWGECIHRSMLQSGQTAELLSQFSLELKANSWAYASDLGKTLRRSCMDIDFETMERISNSGFEGKVPLQEKPSGHGWKDYIAFLYSYKEEIPLEASFGFVGVLDVWCKSNHSGETTRQAGRVALALIEKIEHDSDRYRYNDAEETCVTVILEAAGELSQELAAYCAQERDWDDRKERNHPLFRGMVNDSLSTRYVARAIPNEYSEFLFNAWTIKANHKDQFYEMAFDCETEFALRDCGRFHYPTSAMQTPVYALFRADWETALRLVCRIADHVADSLMHSDFADECLEASVRLGEIDRSYIFSGRLWTAHLFGCGSDLYSSIMMAFERWLLEVSDVATPAQLEHLCFTALMASHSCSVVSIVVSAVLNAPEKCPDVLCVLLSCRAVIMLDKERWINGRCYPVVPPFAGYYLHNHDREVVSKYRISEKQISNAALQVQLDNNLILLDGKTSASDHIHSIIDDMIGSSDEEDAVTRWAYQQMDSRRLEVVGNSDDPNHPGVVLEINPDEDLAEKLKQHKATLEDARPSQSLAFYTWAHNGWEKGAQFNDDFDSISAALAHAKGLTDSDGAALFLRDACGYTVAIALRDFLNELSESELEWCYRYVSECLGSANAYSPHQDSSVDALVKSSVLSAARGVGEFPIFVARLVVGPERALHSSLMEAIGTYYSGNIRAIEAFLAGYLTAGKFWDKRREGTFQLPAQERRLSNDELMDLLLRNHPQLPERIIAMDLGVSNLEDYVAHNPKHLAMGFVLVAACSDDVCDPFAIENYIKAASSGLIAHRNASWIFDSQVGFVRQIALWLIKAKPSCYCRVLVEVAPLLLQQYVGGRFLSELLHARLRGKLDDSLFFAYWSETYEACFSGNLSDGRRSDPEDLLEALLFADPSWSHIDFESILDYDRWDGFFSKVSRRQKGAATLTSFAYLLHEVVPEHLANGLHWCAAVIRNGVCLSSLRQNSNMQYYLEEICTCAVDKLGPEMAHRGMLRGDLRIVFDFLIDQFDSSCAYRLRDLIEGSST